MLLVARKNWKAGGYRSFVPEGEGCTPCCDDTCPCDGDMERSHTGYYDEERGEREMYAEHVLHATDSTYKPVRGDLAPVGLCPLRRECHLVSPWTRAQRRVRRAWAGRDRWDDGLTDWIREQDGKPELDWQGVNRKTPISAEPLSRSHTQDLLNTETVYVRHTSTAGGVLDDRQARVDREEASPGSAWLREYVVDPGAVMERALAGHGLTLADVLPAFASKGRPTRAASKLRGEALRILAPLCPEVVPVAAAARVLGIHRVQLSAALSKARAALTPTPRYVHTIVAANATIPTG